MLVKNEVIAVVIGHRMVRSGTRPLLVKGRRDPSVRSEEHADSRYGIVTVGITHLHFTLSTTRHGLESSTS